MYSQNNKIILHVSCKPQVLFYFVFITRFFQIFHLWAIVLSHQIPSFYISFTLFFYICSSPSFHPIVVASVLLSFFFSFFFLPFFTSIACSFFLSLLFSSLHTNAFVGFIILFYGFICFWINGFCLGLCRGGRDGGQIFVHGLCVCAVVGLCELGF